jgi:hypothetical protein
MDALLVFSAYHLNSVCTPNLEISQASHKYLLRAIRGHARDISDGIHEQNAESVFATAIFMLFHSNMSPQYLDSNIGTPLNWFRIYQGLKVILRVGRKWLSISEIYSIIRDGNSSLQIRVSLGERAPAPFNFLLDDLDKTSFDDETIECYESSVVRLNWVYDHPTLLRTHMFSAKTSPMFIKLLSDEDPRILTIVGYFFMLLKKVGNLWWLDGTAEGQFKGVMKLLPENWWPRMSWAKEEFEWTA